MSAAGQSSGRILFNVNFLIISILVILIELTIATYFKDGFVRPLLGDFFVAILCYSLVRIFLNYSPKTIAIWVLLFTFLIEVSQAFSLIKYLGLTNNRAAQMILGTSFDWLDLIAYTLGILFIYFLDPLICKIK